MKITFGMPEVLIIAAAYVVPENLVFSGILVAFGLIGSFTRYAISLKLENRNGNNGKDR
jgi:hypothetical protein